MSNPAVTAQDNTKRLRMFAARCRLFMRDFKELNRLVKGHETSPRLMVFAVVDTLQDVRSTPPLMYFDDDYLLDPVTGIPSILMRGVLVHVLQSVGVLQLRNHLDVSDGGVQVGISNKSPMIQHWVQLFMNHYEQSKVKWLVAKNIEGAFGYGVSSEYDNLGGWYGDFTSTVELN
jgi:hypothetical protein